jgi:alkylated DNA repair dioxygenase AlkB
MTCRTDLAVPSDFFAQALENTPWQTEPGIMGKAALRKTALWGAPYDYLGVQSNQPIDGPLPEFLAKPKKINDDALGVVTDSVLLNLYQDGRAGINAHSDWGHPGIIGSWSFGEQRVFRMVRGSEQYDIQPAHGSLIVITDEVNETWKHMLLKTQRAVLPRINVTFRKLSKS